MLPDAGADVVSLHVRDHVHPQEGTPAHRIGTHTRVHHIGRHTRVHHTGRHTRAYTGELFSAHDLSDSRDLGGLGVPPDAGAVDECGRCIEHSEGVYDPSFPDVQLLDLGVMDPSTKHPRLAVPWWPGGSAVGAVAVPLRVRYHVHQLHTLFSTTKQLVEEIVRELTFQNMMHKYQ